MYHCIYLFSLTIGRTPQFKLVFVASQDQIQKKVLWLITEINNAMSKHETLILQMIRKQTAQIIVFLGQDAILGIGYLRLVHLIVASQCAHVILDVFVHNCDALCQT